jgi:hypothetical protein
MELFLFQPMEYALRYGCVNITVDSIPLERRRQPFYGWLSIVLYCVFESFGVPVCMSLFQHCRENSCYTLLFLVSVVDVLTLNLLGLLTGVLAIHGVVFCQQPTLIYVSGCVLQALWALETTANIVLVCNRCLVIAAPKLGDLVFEGLESMLCMRL